MRAVKFLGAMAILLSLLAMGSCQSGDQTAVTHPTGPAVGGGDHRIIHITILDGENHTLVQDRNRKTLRVGEKMPLEVTASWAIPYVGDVTDKTKLTVSDPRIGKLDAHNVFTARKPGKVLIVAVLRVAEGSGEHEVLDYSALPPAGVKVVEFRDQIELTVSDLY